MKKSNLLFICTLFVFFAFKNNRMIGQMPSSNFANIVLDAKMVEERKVKLTWIAPVAYHTSSFVIEKSHDGVNFEGIGQTQARFDDKKRTLYAMYDEDFGLLDKECQYRLVEWKEDGQSKMTGIVTVNLNENSTTLTSTGVSSSSSSKISIEKNGMLEQIRIKGSADFKLAQVMLTKDQSDLGFVCDLEANGDDEMLLKPLYQLESGDYIIKVKDAVGGVKKFKFTIKDSSAALN